MKAHIKDLSLLSVLVTEVVLIVAGGVTAQTFTSLYHFTGGNDGANPHAGVVLSDNTLYGTTAAGGSSGSGTVFAVNTDGTGFKTLHSFTNDGTYPFGGLVLSDGMLYGTTTTSIPNNGTIFAVNTNGTVFRTLHVFGSDQLGPSDGLVLWSNTLYGSTGWDSGGGTVFKISTDGIDFNNLYTFTGGGNDGASPNGDLILFGNRLYGTTVFGGTSSSGTIFGINPDGSGFKTLYSFTAPIGSPRVGTNSDGASPFAGLVVLGNTLYGTASDGGGSGYGTVFAVNTDGTGFKTLHTFVDGTDGIIPIRGLILSNNTLYGMAGSDLGSVWGSPGSGSVFAMSLDGTAFNTLHTFSGGSDGGTCTGLILSGNTLYGTTSRGGGGNGTIFSISFTPKLTIIPFDSNLILRWPTNYAGFDYTGYTLQSTTNLLSSAWDTNLTPPVVMSGQNVVTNPISGTQQFFRLKQ